MSKRNVKTIMALFMIFILAAAMIGCGNSSNETDNNSDARVSGQPEGNLEDKETGTDISGSLRGASDAVRSIIISANFRLPTLENKQVLRTLSRDELNLAELGIGVNGDSQTIRIKSLVVILGKSVYNGK